MDVVLDASAGLALLRGETGGDIVRAYLIDPNTICHVHATNLYEIYYLLIREKSETAALQTVHDLQDTGVIMHEDMDAAF